MKYKKKKCSHCGNSFQPTGANQQFCSLVCRIKDNIIIDGNNCWNWTGCKNNQGYGRINHKKQIFYTHRVMCESVHGPAPIDKPFALHSCDNPACCNPDHLRWGSQQENMDDKKERGRCVSNGVKGEQNGSSKLTEEQVIEIINKLKGYKRGDYVKLAKEYGVSKSAISDIHLNKIWTYLSR